MEIVHLLTEDASEIASFLDANPSSARIYSEDRFTLWYDSSDHALHYLGLERLFNLSWTDVDKWVKVQD